jgi:hypothetical protein
MAVTPVTISQMPSPTLRASHHLPFGADGNDYTSRYQPGYHRVATLLPRANLDRC